LKNILWIGLIGLGYLFFKSVSKKIQIIGIPNINFGKPGILSIPFTLGITINNANNFPLNVTDYLGTLLYQGNKVANFSLGKTQIGPGQSQQINLTGSISYTDVAINILSIIESKKFDSKFTVNSTLIYENVSIPLNYDLQIV